MRQASLLFLFFVLAFNAPLQGESEIRLSNNRFRIDDTVEKAVFIIHREYENQPSILVQPDGTKFYSNRHPENVFWQASKQKDIITIMNPQPGPWQALGKISFKNKVKLLTNLSMNADILPKQLYQGESIKFTVRLLQSNQALTLFDYLDSVKLVVTFVEVVENIDDIPQIKRPKPITLATFKDDGKGLDEHANDGVFTLALAINLPPGAYRAKIMATNEVFFRAVEQNVLVFPSPVFVDLAQSREMEKKDKLVVKAQKNTINLENLFIHAEFHSPTEEIYVYEKRNSDRKSIFSVELDNFDVYGEYVWNAWVYAKDILTERELVFTFFDNNFEVVNFAAIEKAKQERAQRKAERERSKQKEEQAQRQADERKRVLFYILVGNFIILVLALSAWLFTRKHKFTNQS